MFIVSTAAQRLHADCSPLLSHSEQMLLNVLPTTSRGQAMMTSFIPLTMPMPTYCVTLSQFYETLPLTSAQRWGISGRDDLSLAVRCRQPVQENSQYGGFPDSGTAKGSSMDSVRQNESRSACQDVVSLPTDGRLFPVEPLQNEENPNTSWTHDDVRMSVPSVVTRSGQAADDCYTNAVTNDSFTVEGCHIGSQPVAVHLAPIGETSDGGERTPVYPLYCTTCRLRLNAPRQAKEHFEGRGHARRLRFRGQNAAVDVTTLQNMKTGESTSKQVSKKLLSSTTTIWAMFN